MVVQSQWSSYLKSSTNMLFIFLELIVIACLKFCSKHERDNNDCDLPVEGPLPLCGGHGLW